MTSDGNSDKSRAEERGDLDQGRAGSTLAADPGASASRRPQYKPLWNNLITMAGMLLVIAAVMLLVTFALFSVVARHTNPYVDIIGFLVLPSILILGLLTMPIGILIKSWRIHRRHPEEHLAFQFPRVDLNDPAQRRVAKLVVLGTFIFLPVVGVSSYHGYNYTESAEFCAKPCHAVMQPQATAYEHSAHARVPCAECHIGAGAGWFVKSKLSGTRQVLAMWQDSYPRPIPPAITNLRPARETCEECHWPRKFFGAQLREIVRFSSDENNTRRDIDMLLLTGGGDETTGSMGIHKHMALSGRVRYIATDDRLQEIPWVEFIDDAGQSLIYRSDGRPSSDPRPEGQERTLDCMDCHNRPAHKFRSPQQAVDVYLTIGNIDTDLPFIKREATKVLAQSYPDAETAEVQIGAALAKYYRTNHADVWEARRASINAAIDKVREIYRRNFFPDMQVDWQTYPDNIGHLISPGCFRCHEGRHVNQRGEQLSHKCSVCHTFLNRVDPGEDSALVEAGAFVHSYELQGSHADLRCDRCHSGGIAPVPDCAGCHVEQAAFGAGLTEAFGTFDIDADPMAGVVDCDVCHDLDEPTDIETINVMCIECHEDEEERFTGMLASWAEEVVRLMGPAEEQADAEGHRLLEALRRAGPLHNIEATRVILSGLIGDPVPASQP